VTDGVDATGFLLTGVKGITKGLSGMIRDMA
jgi:hypothetical protein